MSAPGRTSNHPQEGRDKLHYVDGTIRLRFRELADKADDLLHRVDDAFDGEASHSFMVETRAKVDALGAELKGALAGLGEKARSEMERTVGRKIADLQKRAARLPALSAGSAATTTANTGFIESRPPPRSRASAPKAAAPRKLAPRKTVRPKRVARTIGAPSKPPSPLTQATLDDAAVVKPYSMEGSYEVGDIIAHATFGRGRVERVQPRAMQVQFAIGMKSLRSK
jgi:hypothetical protein